MEVNGKVSQYYAKVDIRFRSQCEKRKYLCKLNFINLAGHVDTIHAAVEAKMPDDHRSNFTENSELILVSQFADTVNLLTYRTHKVEEGLKQLTARFASYELAAAMMTRLLDSSQQQKKDCPSPSLGGLTGDGSYTNNTGDHPQRDEGSEVTDLRLGINPTTIVVGLSSDLYITCTFNLTESSAMAKILSLIISRRITSGESFSELATITVFSPHKLSLMTQENITSSGNIDSDGQSYIYLHWEYPSEAQKGTYTCLAQGVDSSGHYVVKANSTVVTTDKPDTDDLLDKIREMVNYVQELEHTDGQLYSRAQELDNKVMEMNNYTQELDNKIMKMDSYPQELEKKIKETNTYAQELEKEVKKMDSYSQSLNSEITGMKSRIEDLEQFVSMFKTRPELSSIFEPFPLNYGSQKYYVSKAAFQDIDESATICQMFGGYLAIINDRDEYRALQTYLGKFGGIRIVFISGTDKINDGKWVLHSSNSPVPFEDWYTSGASTSTKANCLTLDKERSWRMDDWYCHYDPPIFTHRFLCEIPQ